jgi:outer membrane protein assembly factor BamB
MLLMVLGFWGCGTGSTPPDAPPPDPSIATQPADQTVTVGQSATFAVEATGTAPFTYQWQENGTPISHATASSYTVATPALEDDGAVFRVIVSNSLGSVTSDVAKLGVHPPRDVTTYHNDNARTGQNLNETFLTPSNVNVANFGKLGFFPVDGKVDAQPLFLANIAIPAQGTHNVLYVATEHDSVYAFDADTGALLWQSPVFGSGETPSDDQICGAVTPEIGISATPVIDRARGVIYVVAMSKGSGIYHQRLHALNISNGAEMFGGPTDVQATFPGTGDNSDGHNVIFDPRQYLSRAGLLEVNGTLYTTWSSHCDNRPYTGWIIGFDALTLAQTAVLNLTPNGYDGAIWMSGAGPAADSRGNIYLLDGNGTFDTDLDANGFPSRGDFGNAFLKLSTTGKLAVADYFATYDTVPQSEADYDLGSGGALVLPDLHDAQGVTRRLALGAGKRGTVYVVNRDELGKFDPKINRIYQEIPNALGGGIFSAQAYFDNRVYFGAIGATIKAFAVVDAKLVTPAGSQTPTTFGYPGATPSISANGNLNAILWAAENGAVAALHAYDATDLSRELYNSNQAASGRDQFGAGNKFITPTVANGKVYVATTNGVAVFGLLP